MIDLQGKICLVTGGSRGVGKGIAVQLGHYGATCYVSGRNLDTLQELIKEVEDNGGSGKIVPVQCDHANDEEIKKLFERIDKENEGKLDLLVNNAFSAVDYLVENAGKNFWEQSPAAAWDVVNNVGLRSHYICSTYAAKLMVKKRQGLIINVSSPGGLLYLFSATYGIGKAAKDRMAQDAAIELRKYKVAFVSLWPALAKTEKLMAKMEKSTIPGLHNSMMDRAESPTFIGRTVAALLSEPHPEVMMKTGKTLLTVDIARKHGITDEQGKFPISMCQLNFLLTGRGYHRLASYIPDFIRIPFWLFRTAVAYQTS